MSGPDARSPSALLMLMMEALAGRSLDYKNISLDKKHNGQILIMD
jgi:hypothetical protein